ncbi:DUF5994 family protein [Asanoa sp. NPDC049573]|uniref:DUF5994 family protein n=1 Tax=Asanoa sp. NPDC049573 TaxID=3155396 RepID=UPI00342D8E63
MPTISERATIVASTPPSSPRLVLAPVRANQAVLDGGWWPRSWDPVAELPGLVLALSARYGTIRQFMLNSATWDTRFKRIAVGDGVVRVGWFTSIDPAVVIATTYGGDQVDLLVVPPATAPAAADKVMAEAADPANFTRAQAILAAMTAAPVRVADDDGQPAWDNEGGRTLAPARRALSPAR